MKIAKDVSNSTIRPKVDITAQICKFGSDCRNKDTTCQRRHAVEDTVDPSTVATTSSAVIVRSAPALVIPQ